MESDSEMDMLVESFDGTESDDDLSLGESFDALVCVRANGPHVLVAYCFLYEGPRLMCSLLQRGALLTKDKTQVLTALKILRKNSSEREGTMYHQQGMAAASRLANEVVYLFKIGDQDIQVTQETNITELMFPGQCELGSRQHLCRLTRTSKDYL